MDDDLALFTWPAWKFGMKRDDLFTRLHDQYNTIPSSIQDPEAFHHDVFEISHEASSTEDFHRLMAERKEQRLHELNDLLESASLRIISNPALITSDQWEHAVQLFRTKSLDSLVRYFASYLPPDDAWHHYDSAASDHDSVSNDSLADSHNPSLFDSDISSLTHEPVSMFSSGVSHLPPSPRSMTTCSDDSAAVFELIESSSCPASSFSQDSSLEVDSVLQPSGTTIPITSTSDVAEPHHMETLAMSEVDEEVLVQYDPCTYPVSANPLESDSPTPKPESGASCFFEAKLSPVPSSLHHASLSPARAFPLVHAIYSESRTPRRSPKALRRDMSPTGRGRRSSPARPKGRIRKPLPEQIRSRSRGRRRGRLQGSS